MKVYLIFKSTKVRILKPMTWFNGISRRFLKSDFDHVEFYFDFGIDSVFLGADGSKAFKKVRILKDSEFYSRNKGSKLIFIEIKDVKDIFDQLYNTLDTPYDYQRTLLWHLVKKLTGSWPTSGKESEKFSCEEFVAYGLGLAGWKQMNIQDLWEMYDHEHQIVKYT